MKSDNQEGQQQEDMNDWDEALTSLEPPTPCFYYRRERSYRRYAVALDLGITPETIAATERQKQAILKMPKLSAEEYIAQSRKMLGREGCKPYQPQTLESGNSLENADNSKPS